MSQIQPDNCGCCDTEVPELAHTNPPGQPAINYRLARQPEFLARMLSRLSTTMIPDGDNAAERPLAALTSRETDDPAVAFLDAWAVLADVLCFYQERIANEGFLRTATERLSVLQLARAIGYELNPGVAAGTYLAFNVNELKGGPVTAVLPAGSQVMSVPGENELPQTFETGQDFTARAAWNSLRPRLSQSQALDTGADQFYVTGLANLTPGQRILVVSGSSYTVRRLYRAEVDAANNQTRLVLSSQPDTIPAFSLSSLDAGQVDLEQVAMTEATVRSYILEKEWADADLRAFLESNEWDEAALLDHLADLTGQAEPDEGDGLFVLGESLNFFGHNAPHYDSLATDESGVPFYPGPDWDSAGWEIWHEPLDSSKDYFDEASAYLERKVDKMLPDSWVLLRQSGGTQRLYWVEDVSEKALVGFSLSATVTGLHLATMAKVSLADNTSHKPSGYKVRSTTAFRQTELLELAELPLEDDIATSSESGETVGAREIMLAGLVLGLEEGQAMAVSGERVDAPGIVVDEIAIIEEIRHLGGYTIVTFEEHLSHPYLRETVTLNANCVPATHGQTVSEILGSGNGARRNQSFRLSKPPLTYVSSSSPSGGESSLEIRVDGVLWQEVDSLYGLGPADECYTVRLSDDGYAHVIFGDGIQGARLPTGVQNIQATYRSGTGLDGEVVAGALSLLQSRPLGLKDVINPKAASGGQDPETLEDARDSAPLAILTLDRIVSLRDYEDFARAFAGVGKARVVVLWDGSRSLVHITIATAGGDTVDESADLWDNLADAIADAADPRTPVLIDTYRPRFFNVSARLLVDERYEAETVLAEAEERLKDEFAFSRRGFGQPVAAAELIQILQGVEGVVAVDLDQLYLVSDSTGPSQTEPLPLLPSAVAHWDGSDEIALAELLLVNSAGIDLQEMPA